VRINKDGGHFGTTDNDVNLSMLVKEFSFLDFLMLNPGDDAGEERASKMENREFESFQSKSKWE